MHIVIFSDWYLPSVGGVQRSIENQRLALTELGHRVTVVCASPGRGHASDDPSTIYLPTPPVRSLDGLHRVYVPLPGAHRRLARRLTERGPVDVVHSHTEFFVGRLGARVARLVGAPHLATTHTNMARQVVALGAVKRAGSRCFLAVYNRFRRSGWRGVRSDDSWIEAEMWRFILGHANTADVVITPSAHFRDKLLARGLAVPSRVIPNGHHEPTGDFRPSDPESPLTIVWIGRLEPEKQPMTFIEAVATVDRQARWRALMFGAGSLFGPCERAIAQHGLADRVTLVRNCPHERLREHLRRADLFVMTSSGFDNHPMVLVEALAAQLPIVYCDPDLGESLTPDNSLLVAPEASSVATGIARVLADDDRRREMARSSWRLAPEYTALRQAQKLLAVYQEMSAPASDR